MHTTDRYFFASRNRFSASIYDHCAGGLPMGGSNIKLGQPEKKLIIPHESTEKCQNITLNLLHLLTKDSGNVTSEAFVRELAQTERCFAHQPKLRLIVDNYEKFITPATYARVKDYKQTIEDEQRCTAALIHYRYWSSQQLRRCLPWHLRIEELCSRKAGDALTVFTLASGVFVAAKGVNLIIKKSYEKMQVDRHKPR